MIQKKPFAIFDGHNDTLLRHYLSNQYNPRAFFIESQDGHLDLPRAKKGGMVGGFFAIFTPPPEGSPEREPLWEIEFTETGYRQKLRSPIDPDYAQAFTIDVLDFLNQLEAAAEGTVQVVTEMGQLIRCIQNDVFAILVHLEGAEAIQEDLGNLEDFYRRGVRSLGLVWSRPNVFGSGVPFGYPQDPDTGPGLTRAGMDLVKECNRLGILIDLAHLNAKGFWDVQKLSSAPLVVTHADVFAICPSTRNLTDDQITAIGESDGVIGINFETLNTRADGLPETNTPLSQIVKHVDYIVEKMGVDHVAFGSDFDGADMPEELKDASGLPKLIQLLESGGYSQGDIEKITHQNWLRVLGATMMPPQ